MVNIKKYIQDLSAKIFSNLSADEEISLFLHSEESQFVRFNQSKIRQNTSVDHHLVFFQFQKNRRTCHFTYNLTLSEKDDLIKIEKELNEWKEQFQKIDENPQFLPMVNNGSSTSCKKVDRPSDEEVIRIINSELSGSDMAGLYSSGPIRQASLNSKGQFHYFETDYFFLDYSLYNGPRAAKGFYSPEKWSLEDFKANIQSTIQKLNLLNRPMMNIPRGQYRTYLEPMAVHEIISTLNWGGLSFSALKQGRNALRKFFDKEVSLSPQFNLVDNLDLGYSPLFNSLGEVGASQINIIQNGQPMELLTSSSTAKEYNAISNFAETSEFCRSPEIRAGTLAKSEVLKQLNTGLYLSNLHYLNWSDMQSARITGMTRYACFWVENGEIKAPIQDLRFDDSVYNLFGSHLINLTSHQDLFVNTGTYNTRSLGAVKVPGALIENFNFTL